MFFCFRVVSLCMSPINDSFMSGSLDRSVRLWDLRVNACQVGFQFFKVWKAKSNKSEKAIWNKSKYAEILIRKVPFSFSYPNPLNFTLKINVMEMLEACNIENKFYRFRLYFLIASLWMYMVSWFMLTLLVNREFYIYVVGLQLRMTNKAWCLQLQWKEVLLSYLIPGLMTRLAT